MIRILVFGVRFQGKGEIKIILPIRLKWKIHPGNAPRKERGKKTVVSMYPEEQQQ